ncbi:putative ankyrin repeat domain-containing protein 52 protein [Eutypa lata UCREL1]|uniref:Putative ankyrin repeat domain-containing protein 52 protein n=1 Tax=Eutypa lata (strain UCR-EL1) TaxID=1287681 RepID=M7TMP7_EUTLA|nr:putative ankyrin repeat domain-containing protein 52 protein [Eutypa lata UCREL1]
MESLDRIEDDLDDVFLQDSLCPTIAEHATQCNALFHKYMMVAEIVSDPTIIDDQLARFTLWASNMDVWGPLNVSLDYRLRFSPTVVGIIHQLLDVICDSLNSLKPINEPKRPPSRKRQRLSEHHAPDSARRVDDDGSDFESDIDQAEENISKITDTVGGTVTRLFRLSNAVRKSAKANRVRKMARYRDDIEANKAIAERSHRRRIGLSSQGPYKTPAANQLPKIKESAPVAGQHGSGPLLTFETSKAWINHMQNAHGHTWECRAPSHDPIIFDEEIQYQEHSIKEHGVPEMHAGILSNAARRPNIEKVLECPFGDDFQHPDKAEPSTVFASEALQLHVAAHIKEVALLALQKLPNDGVEDADDVASDQPPDDDMPGHAGLRGSMYSILDDEALDLQDDEAPDFQDDAEAVNPIFDYREEDISPSVERLDLEDKDDSGMTKLHHAVYAGNLNLAESLLSGGASLNSRDNCGRTVLHYASLSQYHDHNMMSLLLNAGSKAFMNLGDDNGQTALHYTAERGFTEDIRILVEHGVDINTTDNYGFSPCLWSVVSAQFEAVDLLLAKGADVNLLSAEGKTALEWAANLGWTSMVIVLVHYGVGISRHRNVQVGILEEAAALGDLNAARLLLASGGDPSQRDRDGWSAIHWAAEEGHPEIVDLLLKAGTSVDAVSSYGTAPLHCAANGGHVSIVSLLLLAGADPLKSTCHGWTALHHAAFMGHSRVVQRLLEDDRARSGASQQDNHGWSLLHLAVHSRDLATVQVLLDDPAIPEPQALIDESGHTAEEWLDFRPASHSYRATSDLAFSKSRCCRVATGLRQAVIIGNIPMIKLLLRLGHNVNDTNSGRRTALYYSAKKSMLSIMDLLLDNGADANILPAGRKSWEEFISDRNVLLRLDRAGYKKRGDDPEVAQQIRIALRAQGVPSVQNRSVSFAPVETFLPISPQSTSSIPGRSTSSVPALEVASSSDHSASITPTLQTNNNKRKAKSARSGISGFWKRILG